MWLWAKKTISAPRYGVDARPPPFEPDTVAEFGGPGQNATPYRGGSPLAPFDAPGQGRHFAKIRSTKEFGWQVN